MPAWDSVSGTAGGAAFGAALQALAAGLAPAEVAEAAGLDPAELPALYGGSLRVSVAQLARLAALLKLHAIEFLQRSAILSLEVYAGGLDPLYFLPEGQTRYDARIYMREINPRHAVPERDMFVRNPTLKALAADPILDRVGKLELELAYLLRSAAQRTGGTL